MKRLRTTVFLPEEMERRLRQEAVRSGRSVPQLADELLRDGHGARGAPRGRDPLLDVIGIIHDGKLAEGIDEALYGI